MARFELEIVRSPYISQEAAVGMRFVADAYAIDDVEAVISDPTVIFEDSSGQRITYAAPLRNDLFHMTGQVLVVTTELMLASITVTDFMPYPCSRKPYGVPLLTFGKPVWWKDQVRSPKTRKPA